MKTVWKYTLDAETVVQIPVGYQTLDVHEQNGKVCMWALVDDKNPIINRKFILVGTGFAAPDISHDANYVGTAYLCGGSLVLHVFDVFGEY
jgi:hypothetical protein